MPNLIANLIRQEEQEGNNFFSCLLGAFSIEENLRILPDQEKMRNIFDKNPDLKKSDNLVSKAAIQQMIHIMGLADSPLEYIKKLSKTQIGKALLEEGLKDIKSLSNENLQELRIFFVETYQKELFEAINNILMKRTNALSNEPVNPALFDDALMQNKIKKLLNCRPVLAHKLSNIMTQLKIGLGQIESDESSAAPYIVGAIASDKAERYEFSPICVSDEKFGEYLALVLEKKPLPILEHFVVMGDHWTAGAIKMKENGEVDILILDSLGKPENSESSEFEVAADKDDNFLSMFSSTEFKSILENRKVQIYHAYEQRQNDLVSCNAYALDDVRHLYTVERYLNSQDLFTYLENHKDRRSQRAITANMSTTFSSLPEHFLRTMQSNRVFSHLESQGIVNKKGETAKISTEKHFRHNPSKNKKENKRIDDKFGKMIRRLEEKFSQILEPLNDIPINQDLAEKNFEKFQTQCSQYTYEGFKKRIEEQYEFVEHPIGSTCSLPTTRTLFQSALHTFGSITQAIGNLTNTTAGSDDDEEILVNEENLKKMINPANKSAILSWIIQSQLQRLGLKPIDTQPKAFLLVHDIIQKGLEINQDYDLIIENAVFMIRQLKKEDYLKHEISKVFRMELIEDQLPGTTEEELNLLAPKMAEAVEKAIKEGLAENNSYDAIIGAGLNACTDVLQKHRYPHMYSRNISP